MKKILLIIIVIFITIGCSKKEVNEVEKNEYTDRIPVIAFHRIVSDENKKNIYPNNKWVGSEKVFDQMMKYIHDNGYETISTEEFYEWYIGKREYSKKTVLITLDDGFYEDYYIVYPILKKYNLKATSFVVGSRIKETTNDYNVMKTNFMGFDVISEIRTNYPNYEIQSHTYNMHYYTSDKKHRIKSMTYEELVNDVKSNEKFNFTTLAYPYGDYNDDIKKILEDNNYLVAFRFSPPDYAYRTSDRYAIPRIKITGESSLDDLKKWLEF